MPSKTDFVKITKSNGPYNSFFLWAKLVQKDKRDCLLLMSQHCLLQSIKLKKYRRLSISVQMKSINDVIV